MAKYHLVVYYEKKILVIIECDVKYLWTNDILDWYAKAYAFDRSKLAAVNVDCIQYSKELDCVNPTGDGEIIQGVLKSNLA